MSQHLYGYAADFRIPGVRAHYERRLAKRSQVQGLSCYSSMSINHIDLRFENRALPELHHWWWPDLDRLGRYLTDDGERCWGE